MKKHNEFSKLLLIQESLLIWIITFAYIILAFVCILRDYSGSLPWLSVIPGLAWTAYGVSQGFYYNKSKKENTEGGIKYETVMTQLQNDLQQENKENNDIDINYGV